MKRYLSFIVSFIILITLFSSYGAENSMLLTQRKNYTIEKQTYLLDFSSSKLNDYTEKDGFKFINEQYGSIKDGKLYCQEDKAFDIRSASILGNDYALETAHISFDMLLKSGTVSIGTRLKSTVSNTYKGIWFNIDNKSLKVIVDSKPLENDIKHGFDLNKERTYIIKNSSDNISLYITDNNEEKLVVSVDYDYLGNIEVFNGNGESLGNIDNKDTPQTGFWKMQIINLDGYIDNVQYETSTVKQNIVKMGRTHNVDYSTWVATDDLNRTTPVYDTTGGIRKDKYIGLFYFICHVSEREDKITNITNTYLELGLDKFKDWLYKTQGGYWSEPYFGYYLSTDEWIYRKHANMFNAAGIDFIFLDMSNAITYPQSHKVLFDTWLKIRQEGGTTPYIVTMSGDNPGHFIKNMYVLKDTIFNKPEYEDLFFKWDGKPLIFGNNDDLNGDIWSASPTIGECTPESVFNMLSSEEKEFYESGEFKSLLNKFTVRKCWAWQARQYKKDKVYAGYWDWLDDWPQGPGRSFKGVVEQVSVSIASHAHTNKGRSFIKGNTDYGTGLQDFDFSLETTKYGLGFEEQFEEALKIDPSVIMINQWNEWVAGPVKHDSPDMVTAHTKTPYLYFIDEFNPEFSRDAEPMKTRDGVGFGDNYYYQMVSYNRKFKGLNPIPKGADKGIKINIDIPKTEDDLKNVDKSIMTQWDKIKLKYTDHIGDTTFRNHPSSGLQYQYLNATGRNDFEYAKVTQDDNNLYFLAKTVDNIVTEDSDNWMNLYIDIDMDSSTGWEGYDYILNRTRDNEWVSVDKFVNNSWEFENVGYAKYRMGTDNLTIQVNKKLLNLNSKKASFDFKWSDNSQNNGNVMQFMDLGDTAPDDRFNFRYLSKGSNTTLMFFKTFLKPNRWSIYHYGITLGLIIVTGTLITLLIIYKKKTKIRRGMTL